MHLVPTLAASAIILSFAFPAIAAMKPDHSIPLQLARGGAHGGHFGGFPGGMRGGWGYHHRGRYYGYPYTYACPYPYYYNYAYCTFPNG